MTNEVMTQVVNASATLMRTVARCMRGECTLPEDCEARLRHWAGRLETLRDELLNREAVNITLASAFDNWKQVQENGSIDEADQKANALLKAAERIRIGNTPTCEDCGKPQDHCQCANGDQSKCQNCCRVWADVDLINPIPDIGQRVAPGEPMPSGECPDCGAVCHPIGK